MKVAYLTTYYNGQIDGRFGRFHDWVHTLRDMDDPPFEFDVVALTASNPDETLSSQPHAIFGEATDLWGTKKNNVEFLFNVPRAIRDLVKLDYDVLHVLTFDTIAYPVSLMATNRMPVIGPDIQGYFPQRDGLRWNQGGFSGLKNQTRFRLRGGLAKLAADPTYVTLSRYHADNVLSVVPDNYIVQIPPGVDRIFTPSSKVSKTNPDTTTEFLYVGDLSRYKGYDLFLESLAQLADHIEFKATIIGSGDPQMDYIDSLGLADEVTYEGFVPRDELPPFYRSADFYVMPSVDENGPNTIVEALACGTPVLATDKPGINEYAPASASIYFDRDPDPMTDAMIHGHENREKFSKSAKHHAHEFTAEKTIQALVDCYQKHLDRHP